MYNLLVCVRQQGVPRWPKIQYNENQGQKKSFWVVSDYKGVGGKLS